MTKIQRKELITKIVAELDEITAEEDNKASVLTLGGHEVSRRLLYAGGSQWSGCGRDWERVESGWGWVVDGEYRLTAPVLFGFDGHNMIERQTGFYLQDGYDEQTTPEHDGRDPIGRVPGRILLTIGRGLVDARRKAEEAKRASEAEAGKLLIEMEKVSSAE